MRGQFTAETRRRRGAVAVEHWRIEHFGSKEDPNWLDPAKRAELQKQMQMGE
jgi:hypothetical protein